MSEEEICPLNAVKFIKKSKCQDQEASIELHINATRNCQKGECFDSDSFIWLVHQRVCFSLFNFSSFLERSYGTPKPSSQLDSTLRPLKRGDTLQKIVRIYSLVSDDETSNYEQLLSQRLAFCSCHRPYDMVGPTPHPCRKPLSLLPLFLPSNTSPNQCPNREKSYIERWLRSTYVHPWERSSSFQLHFMRGPREAG